MLKITATITKTSNKSNYKKHQKGSPTVFLSSWTSSLLLGLISSKEKLMKTLQTYWLQGRNYFHYTLKNEIHLISFNS